MQAADPAIDQWVFEGSPKVGSNVGFAVVIAGAAVPEAALEATGCALLIVAPLGVALAEAVDRADPVAPGFAAGPGLAAPLPLAEPGGLPPACPALVAAGSSAPGAGVTVAPTLEGAVVIDAAAAEVSAEALVSSPPRPSHPGASHPTARAPTAAAAIAPITMIRRFPEPLSRSGSTR